MHLIRSLQCQPEEDVKMEIGEGKKAFHRSDLDSPLSLNAFSMSTPYDSVQERCVVELV
jgi:hypothetical protein